MLGHSTKDIRPFFETVSIDIQEQNNERYSDRDVGSISNLGDTMLRGHFVLKKKGHFLRIKRALLCLLQNLGGVRAPSAPPGSYVYASRNTNLCLPEFWKTVMIANNIL